MAQPSSLLIPLSIPLLILAGCATGQQAEGGHASGVATDLRPRTGDSVDGSLLARRVTAASNAARSVRMRTTMPGQGTVSVLDQVRVSPQRTDVGGVSDGIRLRLVGDRYYVAIPGDSSGWEEERADVPPPKGEGVRALRATEPRARAAVYRAGETTYIGRTGRGHATLHHYRTRTLAAKALATCLPTLSRKSIVNQSGDRPVTYDTWLDAQDRPARLTVTIPDATGEGRMKVMRTTFERWGVRVHIRRPAVGRATTDDASASA